jgi:hypothetical protein
LEAGNGNLSCFLSFSFFFFLKKKKTTKMDKEGEKGIGNRGNELQKTRKRKRLL